MRKIFERLGELGVFVFLVLLTAGAGCADHRPGVPPPTPVPTPTTDTPFPPIVVCLRPAQPGQPPSQETIMIDGKQYVCIGEYGVPARCTVEAANKPICPE